MPICIPHIITGQMAISGPPDWLSAAGNKGLDDQRWCGAMQRTFGGGTSQNANFRAIYANVTQQYIYLSFRAPFVQSLADQHDKVYVGLGTANGSKAILISMQAHGSGPSHAGPPWSIPAPTNLGTAPTMWTWDSATNKWMDLPMGTAVPTWIYENARTWVHPKTDPNNPTQPDPNDANNRWAIQLRIPNGGLVPDAMGDCVAPGVGVVAAITDKCGPNLGSDFRIWYLIQGATSTSSSVILADILEATADSATMGQLLLTALHPVPTIAAPTKWPSFHLSTGPADAVCPASSTNGGVALRGSDISVGNADGKIHNHVQNTFIVRPRNYTSNAITPPNMSATFRIANWGSSATNGDPNATPNWGSGTWKYIPGNSAIDPAPSSVNIDSITAGSNPTPSSGQIQLTALMDRAGNETLHQCILVTLSGTSTIFLNDSAFVNMWYDKASMLEREAEISVVGLTPFSPPPRDVYLAIEKINMLRTLPAGTNEGLFLEGSMQRLIEQGGELGEKLKAAKSRLSDLGDYGSGERLESLLGGLYQALIQLKYNDQEAGKATLGQFIIALSHWLLAEKRNADTAKRLAAAFDALANWLLATDSDTSGKLDALIAQISQWLSTMGNDPAFVEFAPQALEALRAWLSTLADDGRLAGVLETLQGWWNAGRPIDRLTTILNQLRELLSSASIGEVSLRVLTAEFSDMIARWLKGYERLDTFVGVLSDAGLTEEQTDQLFPTFRVHAYHDTGERVTGSDGNLHPVLRVQSSFGLYAYHEGGLDGWQTSLQGAQRIADNLYLLAVPNNGTARVTVRIQAVEPGQERIPEDPIKPIPPTPAPTPTPTPGGCLNNLLAIFIALAKTIAELLRRKP
jgi:hypothetical protein